MLQHRRSGTWAGVTFHLEHIRGLDCADCVTGFSYLNFVQLVDKSGRVDQLDGQQLHGLDLPQKTCPRLLSSWTNVKCLPVSYSAITDAIT